MSNHNHNAITHSGFVALIGRPNVGKSTLLNTLLQEKISITSAKAQTTRWQILGIKQLNHTQIVYIDTPGLHQAEKRAMNRYLNRIASATLTEADVLIFMIDAQGFKYEDELILKKLQQVTVPVILAINKIDRLADKAQLLPFIEKLSQQFNFAAIVPISAAKNINIELLETTLAEKIPAGELLFPEDQLTDRSERFLTAEFIREKVIQLTDKELPYTTTVQIEQYQQTATLTKISAVIWVERAGQKAIVIGKQGTKLKQIGTLARKELTKRLQETFGKTHKVYLQLWVKVKTNWTDDVKALRGLGYE